ncbi:hypothetical protein C8R44DRAFT_752854 [Mycena epipterygia]|nr:hypothetical protein C8R44DRAFT_752854 [Mycena epipterygia]
MSDIDDVKQCQLAVHQDSTVTAKSGNCSRYTSKSLTRQTVHTIGCRPEFPQKTAAFVHKEKFFDCVGNNSDAQCGTALGTNNAAVASLRNAVVSVLGVALLLGAMGV